MANQEKVKSIVQDLMERLYDAKGFTDLKCNPLERNLFETEKQEIWEELETHVILYCDEREEYEEEIENLKADIDDLKDYNDGLREEIQILRNDNVDLIDRNYDLAEKNQKLWKRIEEISKVVNDTWS